VVRGEPDALLLVDFAEDDWDENLRRLKRLHEVIGDLGFDWSRPGKHFGGVVEVNDPGLQADLAEVRKSGLNIMMSMRAEGKPVSFVEDCAVELKDLADYTAGLTEVFEKHGTRGTWYAHASVGCLHVRPVLNLKLDKDVKPLRAIAEEAFELVRKYKGSHSGEHGDGIVRSEFHEVMFGARMMDSFRR
jgi:FAD/FMN-containing dehydrogenase